MIVVHHAAVQKDVNRALRHYDELSERLGNEFWRELQKLIAAAAENPLQFHPYLAELRRANLNNLLIAPGKDAF
jgi:hypothetical protein